MSDAALWAAVVANPDDDEPRLVWADWLQERGDPRGEYITIQCELAKLRGPRERATQLAARAHAIQEAHVEAWLAPLRRIGVAPGAVMLRRGLPYRVYFRRAADFVACADELFQLAPIRSVWLMGTPEQRTEVPALLASPGVARLHELVLQRCALTDDEVGAIAASPHVAGLRTLGLPENFYGMVADARGEIRPAVLAALVRAPQLAQLESLDLGSTHLGPAGAEAIAGAAAFRGLRELRMPSAGVADAGAQALAAAPWIGALTFLDLAGNGVGDEGVTALAGAPRLRGLTWLSLSSNRFHDDGVAALARAPWPSLRTLDLHSNRIGPDGLAALAAAPDMPALRYLRLTDGYGNVGKTPLTEVRATGGFRADIQLE